MPESIENRMVSESRAADFFPHIVCNDCGCSIFDGDNFYEIEGAVLCEECARAWLKERRKSSIC